MKLSGILLNIPLIAFTLSVGTVNAQDSDTGSDSASMYHPFLSDTFYMNLGVYNARNEVTVGVGIGGIGGEEIGTSKTEGNASLAFRWRYTENWSLWTQYWTANSSTTATLKDDISFGEPPDDKTILAGSDINLSTDLDIIRLFFGRSFFKKPQSEWGAGLGLHWMQLGATLTTNVATIPNDPDINGVNSAKVKGGVPLPNLGVWYMYSWSPNWVTTVRADWLDVDLGQYSGNMYDLSVGVNWQFSDHVGVGLAWQAFKFKAEVNDTGDNLRIELDQSGPFVTLSANF